MAWISVHDHVVGGKLRELAKDIGCSQKEALGILVSLWLWGLNNADQTGKLRSCDRSDVAEAVFSNGLSETNTVAWMDGKIAVHVLCPAADLRLKWVMALANGLSLDGEVVMLDKSPMRIKRLQVNNKADYLKEGQLFVTVHYGLLRYKPKEHMITSARVSVG